jgi:hypothetical protein
MQEVSNVDWEEEGEGRVISMIMRKRGGGFERGPGETGCIKKGSCYISIL